MIKSFKSREAEKIFSRQKSNGVPEDIQRSLLRELRTLDRTPVARDEWLSETSEANHRADDQPGRYTIPIDDKWRISFEWRGGHAYEVDILSGESAHDTG